jgi:hypothetical protein
MKASDAAALLVGLFVLSSGCTVPTLNGENTPRQSNGDDGPTGGYPISLEIRFDAGPPEDLYANGTHVQFSFEAHADLDSLTAGVDVPEGVRLVQGNVTHEGPMQEGDVVRLGGVVRASEAGTHRFRAWAQDLPYGDGRQERPGGVLQEEISYRAEGDREDASWDGVQPRSHDILVDLKAGEDPGSLTVHLQAPETTEGVLAWTGFENNAWIRLAEGRDIQTVDLDPDAKRSFEVDYDEEADGIESSLDVHLYPDPSFEVAHYWDRLHYKIEEGNVTVWEEPDEGHDHRREADGDGRAGSDEH